MTNTFNLVGNEEAKGFGSLKAIPATQNTLAATNEKLREAKRQMEALAKSMEEKGRQFRAAAEEASAEAVKAEPAAIAAEEKPAQPQPSSGEERPAAEEKEGSVSEKSEPAKAEQPAVIAAESVKQAPAKEEKPAAAPGQKTYVDEKGNIKVRRFLADRVPAKPTATANPTTRMIDLNQAGQRPRYNRNGQNGAGRPYDPNRPRQNSNGTGSRPYDPNRPRPQNRGGDVIPMDVPLIQRESKSFGVNKNKGNDHGEDRKNNSLNKKAMMKRSYAESMEDEGRFMGRRPKAKKEAKTVIAPKIEHAVIETKEVQIKVLSEKIGITAAEIIKQLFKEGIVKTINDSVDFDYAAVIASNFGVTLEQKLGETFEEQMLKNLNADDSLQDTEKRAPIVTVMGHVDHGKTSLLDAIRKTNVTGGEAGGITQHIGAYTVKINGENITFIDTPGHEAFTAMRARGAQVTDVAILVVAADDGVMPQTVEAINHAKAANVPIVVAINKMDKPEANPDRVKQQLAEYGVLPEEWGGDSIMVPVSAKSGMGISSLLESVLLVAEMRELKANPQKRAFGNVIEAKLDKGRGPVATVLVRNGTLHVGDNVVAGTAVGKIRAMFDDKGRQVKAATPSMPVEVLGFSDVPNAGDCLYAVDEKLAKQVADERRIKEREDKLQSTASVSLDDLFGKISEGQLKVLNIIIKSDVQGSLEAVKDSLMRISNDEVKINPIHGGVGAITETDVTLAKASNAIIIGFNVRPDSNAKALAERENVDIRLYRVIYDAVDAVTSAMKGMLAPKFKETILGQVEVRDVFRITGVGSVAGAYVTSGKVTRNAKIRVYRDNVMVHDGSVLDLKRFKDEVKEVAAGYECGISLVNYNDIKVGDVFEAYVMEEIKE